MRIATSIGFVVLWSFSSHGVLRAQACCSAGPPQLGSLEFSSSPPETFQSVTSGDDQIKRDWLIPVREVYDGGPGKDGIPALVNPQFTAASNVNYLADNDLVIGIKLGNQIRAYPHPILDWHEIVNDDIDDTLLAITYCPLTGSGIAWNRVLGNGLQTTFGVSGLLYNSNLIPYDRASNSNWSQMRLQCVNGELKGQFASTYPIVETTWKTWKEMYPETRVLSSNTGYSRPYGTYPYGDYKTDPLLIFPISNIDNRLPPKERILGIIAESTSKVYRIGWFPDSVGLMNDSFKNLDIVVVGSNGKNFALSYERKLSDGTALTFSPVQNALPVVMIDNEGTKWDLFGKAVAGQRVGLELKPTRSYIAYWFAWGTFFPDAEIHGQ